MAKHIMISLLVIMAIWVIIFTILEPRTLKERAIAGLLFVILHFMILIFLEIFNPGFIFSTWTINNLLGVFILKVPLEEILWAFLFGAIWAPIYEDIKGYTLK